MPYDSVVLKDMESTGIFGNDLNMYFGEREIPCPLESPSASTSNSAYLLSLTVSLFVQPYILIEGGMKFDPVVAASDSMATAHLSRLSSW